MLPLGTTKLKPLKLANLSSAAKTSLRSSSTGWHHGRNHMQPNTAYNNVSTTQRTDYNSSIYNLSSRNPEEAELTARVIHHQVCGVGRFMTPNRNVGVKQQLS